MALKFYWGMEANSNTLGASDYSSSDSTATDSGTIAFSGTAAKIGSYGILGSSGVAGNKLFTGTGIWPATGSTQNTSRGSFGFWMNCVSVIPINFPTGIRVWDTSTNNAIDTLFVTGGYASLSLHNSGRTDFYNGTTAINTNTWYFYVGRFDIANDKRAIEVYTDAGGGTLSKVEGASIEDTTTDLSSMLSGTLGFASLNIGIKASTATDVYYDNFIISDNYDAPIQNNAFITSYLDYTETTGSQLILPHRSSGGLIDLSGNFRG